MSIQGDKLKAIADAIRAKKGTTEPIIADNFASEIASIETGGGATESKLPQVVDRTVTEITASDLAGATLIGDYAFCRCKNLTKAILPDGITSIGYYGFESCSNLTSITIKKTVRSCGGNCFSNCSNLSTVIFEENSILSAIPNHMFYSCKLLSSDIIIPENVTTIGGYAFRYCSALSSVVIPSKVYNIGEYAFYNCTNLQTITVFAATPPTIQSNSIPTNVTTIYIPSGTLAKYSAATNWKTHASKFVELPA